MEQYLTVEQVAEEVLAPDGALIPVPTALQLSADRHPALVYLASVAPGTRASVRSGLQIIAEIMSADRCDIYTMPWADLRAQHTLALRAELAARYAHGTANKMLAYVKGVLRAAWQLDLIDTDSYHRARDIRAVRGESLPRGRAVTQGELRLCWRPAIGHGKRTEPLASSHKGRSANSRAVRLWPATSGGGGPGHRRLRSPGW